MRHASSTCRGRFAPSPTGPLHLGSLYTALARFLEARPKRGQWIVRIDDIDTPRCVPGASEKILKTLEHFGLHWDQPVDYQSKRLDQYREAIHTLKETGRTYPCRCSRKSLEGTKPVYPGWCRNRNIDRNQPHAIRVTVDNHPVSMNDRIQGAFSQNLAASHGDFIIRRRDGIYAYQLAVVLDDAQSGITEVVRGCDLLHNTPRQIHLYRLLGLPIPSYCHIPVLVDQHGHKLSKQTGAPPVESIEPGPLLYQLLQGLGQNPPQALRIALPDEILTWAMTHWNLRKIPKTRQIAIMPSTY